MKITKKFLSVPPFISAPWESVKALHQESEDLIVTLTSGCNVCIPNLSEEEKAAIYQAHLDFLGGNKEEKPTLPPGKAAISFGLGQGIPPELGSAMQHDMANAHAPDLPLELLEKVSSISKIMIPEGAELPEAEPHCNCPHCQIVRAISGKPHEKQSDAPLEEMIEEVVEDEDLKFEQWAVDDLGNRQYTVTNKLDPLEQFHVYLGEETVGCNCGKSGCEHVVAVLNS